MTEFATKYLLSFIEAYEISEEKQREITEAIKAIENEGVLVDKDTVRAIIRDVIKF